MVLYGSMRLLYIPEPVVIADGSIWFYAHLIPEPVVVADGSILFYVHLIPEPVVIADDRFWKSYRGNGLRLRDYKQNNGVICDTNAQKSSANYLQYSLSIRSFVGSIFF